MPEIAARAHIEVVDHLVARALKRAKLAVGDLDGIAAAAGPGLIGGVLVGLMTGKGLALAARKPFMAVNHLEAHALTARLTDNVAFPYLLLLASGGHTQILAVKGVGQYDRLGTTMDDAIGEAFDKTAKVLGLPYPGGPAIEAAARGGDPMRFALPRPMLGRPTADFSLSGLKTATRLAAQSVAPLRPSDVADLSASFQAAIVDIVEDRIRVGLRLFRETAGAAQALVIAGGVAANGAIRHALIEILRAIRPEAGRPAAKPVHGQWRDDRLDRDRAPQARPDRRSRRRGPAALAARRSGRAIAQRQGVRARMLDLCSRSARQRRDSFSGETGEKGS